MIRELVACEHEYINTDHPDFIGGTRAVKVGGGGRGHVLKVRERVHLGRGA